MIGAFDSGIGGLNVLSFTRGLLPDADIIFLRDRKNCPYGSKSKERLTKITADNIKTLKQLGAQTVLIACCTASTVFPFIDKKLTFGVIPIIDCVAQRTAELTENREIAVIATEATVNSHAFAQKLKEYTVKEYPTQKIVELVEMGLTDENCTANRANQLEKILAPLKDSGCDCLILGCTHFSSLRETIGGIVQGYGIKHIADSAEIAASALKNSGADPSGSSSTYYIST